MNDEPIRSTREANAATFAAQGYVVLPQFVPPALAQFLAHEGNLMVRTGWLKPGDPQVERALSAYAPPPTETLLALAVPTMERLTGRRLYPTYSLLRLYLKDVELRPHTDRQACEFSLSLMIAASSAEIWPLMFRKADGAEQAIHLKPGDAIAYRGTDLSHWREKLDYEWHMQAFMHYVDRDGPDADWKFDRRKDLGLPTTNPVWRG
jgi:hypothetical protein